MKHEPIRRTQLLITNHFSLNISAKPELMPRHNNLLQHHTLCSVNIILFWILLLELQVVNSENGIFMNVLFWFLPRSFKLACCCYIHSVLTAIFRVPFCILSSTLVYWCHNKDFYQESDPVQTRLIFLVLLAGLQTGKTARNTTSYET